MYRRRVERDELISHVLVYFTIALAFLILYLWKSNQGSIDAEAIVYIVLGGASTLMWMLRLGMFFYGNRHPLLDVGIDPRNRTIHLLFGRKVLPWSEVRLFAYHRRHNLIRLFVRRGRVSFYLDQMKNDQGEAMDEATMLDLGSRCTTVAPKQLYNHPLTASGFAFVLFLTYAVVYGGNQVAFLGWRYIPTYYILAGLTVLVGAVYALDQLRIRRLMEGHTTHSDTSEN
jgi:hypothetical protein